VAAGLERDHPAARGRLEVTIASGAALRKLAEIIEAQGGNPAVTEDPALLPQAPHSAVYAARTAGRVLAVHPRPVGHGIIAMGGGRTQVEDSVDPSVGFVITVAPGDQVAAGQPLATIYARDAAGLEAGAEALDRAITIGAGDATPRPLVSHRVTARGVETMTG
jgi:thymidine phosphorylase